LWKSSPVKTSDHYLVRAQLVGGQEVSASPVDTNIKMSRTTGIGLRAIPTA